jgi:hypothetical protein
MPDLGSRNRTRQLAELVIFYFGTPLALTK